MKNFDELRKDIAGLAPLVGIVSLALIPLTSLAFAGIFFIGAILFIGLVGKHD